MNRKLTFFVGLPCVLALFCGFGKDTWSPSAFLFTWFLFMGFLQFSTGIFPRSDKWGWATALYWVGACIMTSIMTLFGVSVCAMHAGVQNPNWAIVFGAAAGAILLFLANKYFMVNEKATRKGMKLIYFSRTSILPTLM